MTQSPSWPELIVFLAPAVGEGAQSSTERGVIFRLGKCLPAPKGPGLIVVPGHRHGMVRVSLCDGGLDVPPQDVITRDNADVSEGERGRLTSRVSGPPELVIQVENFLYATSQEAQTTLRSILGSGPPGRAAVGACAPAGRSGCRGIDLHTIPGGVKVTQVAVKGVWTCHRDAAGHGQAGRVGARESGPRSSTPRASSRAASSWPKRRASSARSLCRCTCATCRRSWRLAAEKNSTSFPRTHRLDEGAHGSPERLTVVGALAMGGAVAMVFLLFRRFATQARARRQGRRDRGG